MPDRNDHHERPEMPDTPDAPDAAEAHSVMPEPKGLMDRIIAFFLQNKLITILVMLFVVGWGLLVAPFEWELGGMPRDPVPVDAIPDIGENQQIVFTEWMGRSPQDVEDQVGYPLTVALLGLPSVKTVRSYSMFGFSTIYIIFKEDVDFYWSRSRILEKLSSLPAGTLPAGVKPALGPDATALGQVFWYTIEGRDEQGRPTGGWNLDELRSVQDWYVRYALLAADGVAEVASIGGFTREYQIDVDPDAMRVKGVTLEDVMRAARMSNLDVGARTIEVNKVEYVIRGVGFVKQLKDIEDSVVKVVDNLPIYVRDVAGVSFGPALRRGLLDKEGAEVVGGVVVARYGENPLAAIKNVKRKIAEISPGLPSKVLPDGTRSKLAIAPFYDRSGLIRETLGTLDTALTEEILVTVVVVLVAVMHLASSLLISALLPLAVLMCFIAMKTFGVDANIVALSGIAIAIGTMVDMGIIITENILKYLDENPHGDKTVLIFKAASEVGGAVLTAVSTTIVSFLPVFTMQAAEGKLFKPLAFTKTFALFSSVLVALVLIPPLADMFFPSRGGSARRAWRRWLLPAGLLLGGVIAGLSTSWWLGAVLIYVGLFKAVEPRIPARAKKVILMAETAAVVLFVIVVLTYDWLPLGPEKGVWRNVAFVAGLLLGLMAFFQLFQRAYPPMLRFCLNHKLLFLSLPALIVAAGLTAWLGFPATFGWLPDAALRSGPGLALSHAFPGLGKEFMPPLDEGSFLYMPTTMPHASIGEVREVLGMQDMAFTAIPEVESAVGKLGRAETSLDPAPISMIETVINYRPEYAVDELGERLRFRFIEDKLDYYRDEAGAPVAAPDGMPYLVQGKFARGEDGRLISDEDGKPFRLWRPALDPELNEGREAWAGVNSPDDIWKEIVAAGEVPGVTSAPQLQPIATRIVMLQSGMRAPMGIKVKGPDLPTIEQVGLQLERYLKEVPTVQPAAVFADRIVGKPYLELVIDREAIARYGVMLSQVQGVIEAAVGGMGVTTTVEGRERYSVRVRYQRELRDSVEGLASILVASAKGEQIPLGQLADIRYVRGPQVIKSEDTFLTGYVLFDKRPGFAEVDVVESARSYLQSKIDAGELTLPPGTSYTFAGSYENQVRAQKRLAIVLPLALFIIFLILYLQFKRVPTTLMVFSGILVAWSGGFLMIWCYGQEWFLDFSVFGASMRELFQVHPINLSVAIWVGFLALFGIASDDGVVMATYLDQTTESRDTTSRRKLREAVVVGATRRIRPALMTTATTILALLPVLTSTGRGSDIMVPMAIPSFGGMSIELLTLFIVPTLYCWVEEVRLKIKAA